MKTLIFVSLIFIFLLPIQKKEVNAQQRGIDAENEEDAETFFNRTYSEHQTALEMRIFRNYNTRNRPVKNGSTPTDVDVHWHIIHVSVNQKEQTMTLHGHIYMRWYDEFLVWDPKDFNGIHYVRVKKWQVWQPKIKVSNTASGLGSAFDFSTSAHVIIQMIEKDRAKVEMYPTFSIKVGCMFDFGEFPYDENKCSVNLFATETMAEVQLQNLYNLPPTLSFGWDEQKMKRIISDFKITNVTVSSFYYGNGNVTKTAPVSGFDLSTTWSMLAVNVGFVRHSPYYWATIIAPTLVCSIFILMSFFAPTVHFAFMINIMAFYLQFFFLQDLTIKIPLYLSKTPSPVSLYYILIYSNILSIIFHGTLCVFIGFKLPVPLSLRKIYVVKHYVPASWKEEGLVVDYARDTTWEEWMRTARPIVGLALFFVYTVLFVLFLGIRI